MRDYVDIQKPKFKSFTYWWFRSRRAFACFKCSWKNLPRSFNVNVRSFVRTAVKITSNTLVYELKRDLMWVPAQENKIFNLSSSIKLAIPRAVHFPSRPPNRFSFFTYKVCRYIYMFDNFLNY